MSANTPKVVEPPSLPRPILCRWSDSSHEQGGWIDPQVALSRTLTVVTLGFLVAEDNHQIVVSTTYDPTNGEVLSPVTIPKSAVIEVKEFSGQPVSV